MNIRKFLNLVTIGSQKALAALTIALLALTGSAYAIDPANEFPAPSDESSHSAVISNGLIRLQFP